MSETDSQKICGPSARNFFARIFFFLRGGRTRPVVAKRSENGPLGYVVEGHTRQSQPVTQLSQFNLRPMQGVELSERFRLLVAPTHPKQNLPLTDSVRNKLVLKICRGCL